MPDSEVEMVEEEEPTTEHTFSIPAKRVMFALVVGLVLSLMLTAFSYASFSNRNRELSDALDRRVPVEGLTIELEDLNQTFFCEDPEKDGSFVCVTAE